MRRYALFALMVAAPAFADSDPPGTVRLDLEVGQSSHVTATPGASIICDDLSVARPEFGEDGSGLVLRAVGPGSTLCGVWLLEQVPGGLYRVSVTSPKTATSSSSDGGAARERQSPPPAPSH
jgi:hypothetical protein